VAIVECNCHATVILGDILIYVTQHWLPNHAGSMTADGECIACTKSHLSIKIEKLGRNGDWNSANQTGKPILSAQVGTMLKGCGKSCHQAALPKESSSATDRGWDAAATPKHEPDLQKQ